MSPVIMKLVGWLPRALWLAHLASVAGAAECGVGYQAVRTPSETTIGDLDGTNGFQMTGSGAEYGFVAGSMDLTGDGLFEVVSTSPYAESNKGRVDVLFGRSTGFSSSESVSAGSNGFKIYNSLSSSYMSWWGIGGGDVNNDGRTDMIIGSRHVDSDGLTDNGEAYVIYGKSSFSPSVQVQSLAASDGFIIRGAANSQNLGGGVHSGSDFSGDGVDDIIVVGNNMRWVIYGKNSLEGDSFGSVFSVSSLTGPNGFKLTDSSMSVWPGGDINHDGKDEILVGEASASKLYVIFGGLSAPSGEFSIHDLTLNGTDGFVIQGDASTRFGSDASARSDLNGDGIMDLVVSATEADPSSISNAGMVYIFFGRQSWPGTIDASTYIQASTGFTIPGKSVDQKLGQYVQTGGDFDGDSRKDLVVAGTAYPSNIALPHYVILGKAPGEAFDLELDLATVNGGANGYVFTSDAGHAEQLSEQFGDVNGDGRDDLVIGQAKGSSGSRTYVYFGLPVGCEQCSDTLPPGGYFVPESPNCTWSCTAPYVRNGTMCSLDRERVTETNEVFASDSSNAGLVLLASLFGGMTSAVQDPFDKFLLDNGYTYRVYAAGKESARLSRAKCMCSSVAHGSSALKNCRCRCFNSMQDIGKDFCFNVSTSNRQCNLI